MYSDLDKVAYGKLSAKERNEIGERMPSSLRQAEAEADKKLYDFVQTAVNTGGIQQYANILKQAMSGNAQELLALRCFAAATSGVRIRDTIQIFSNKPMNSIDFFPDSCRGTIPDPKTGKATPYVVDRPDDDDDPYWRASNHASGKHRMVRRMATDQKQTKRDKLPPSMTQQISALLSKLGIHVRTHEEAWEELSNRSRKASIEDRIVARIAYLIMNATIHQDNKLTGQPPRTLPPGTP
jgi:hypothetical protein